MKGDIAFVGFMLTADEWQALDAESRAQLIAVATRQIERPVERPRRFPDGTGRHAVLDLAPPDDVEPELLDDELFELAPADDDIASDLLDDELLDADEPDTNLEPASTGTSDDGWEDFADLNEI